MTTKLRGPRVTPRKPHEGRHLGALQTLAVARLLLAEVSFREVVRRTGVSRRAVAGVQRKIDEGDPSLARVRGCRGPRIRLADRLWCPTGVELTHEELLMALVKRTAVLVVSERESAKLVPFDMPEPESAPPPFSPIAPPELVTGYKGPRLVAVRSADENAEAVCAQCFMADKPCNDCEKVIADRRAARRATPTHD